MRVLVPLFAASLLVLAPSVHARQDVAPTAETLNLNETIGRIAASESAFVARLRTFHPLAELYVQRLKPNDALGFVPDNDAYFLGQFDWRNGPRFRSISSDPQASWNPFGFRFMPDGFLAMASPDWNALDPSHYQFTFVRREFLSEVRCLVFDIQPRNADHAGFTGRIWVEDRGFNIVRFNGISTTVTNLLKRLVRESVPLHFDSWRQNVQPGVWLPSYVYSEETDLHHGIVLRQTERFRAQTRFWGYERTAPASSQEFTSIQIDAPVVHDEVDGPLSPTASQRAWERQAEDNILDRLTKAGLLAPPGDVDHVLETVVNNLEATNSIVDDAPVRCRVLLTTPIESFTVGHTIVLSRGLVDVLPDEASLAAMLARELAHIALGQRLVDTQFAFADRLMIPDGDLLSVLHFARSDADEAAADAKAVSLLANSPYRDRLGAAGLFLRALAARAPDTPHLVRARFGVKLADGHDVRMQPLAEKAPALDATKLDQIAALPIGGRLLVDPWSDGVTLLRAPTLALVSPREKRPLMLTALFPYLRYVDSAAASPSK